MYITNLIIFLLLILIVLKIFWIKEHYDLVQEKCVTITNPTECRMSGCEVGKNNTCVTPRTGQSNQPPQLTQQQNIYTLKQIIDKQNYNSMMSTGNIKPADFSQSNLPAKTSTSAQINQSVQSTQATQSNQSGQTRQSNQSVQSTQPKFSPQQRSQRSLGIRKIADRQSKSFQR